MNGRRRQTKRSNADVESRISAMEKSATSSKNSYGESTKDKARNVPIECKAVLHGFKAESKEEKVKSVIVDPIEATGMTEENTIDCPAIPITHAFVEFQKMKIRDRCVRSANMWKIELDGKKDQNIPRFGGRRKIRQKNIGIHQVYHSQYQRSCTALDTNELREEKHHHRRSTHCENRCHWKAQIQQIRRCRRRSSNSHEEVAVKKLVATTVSSREKGLERRNETMTTSGHHGVTTKNNKKPTEFTSPSTARTEKKCSFQGVKKTRRAKILTMRQLVTETKEHVIEKKRKQCRTRLRTLRKQMWKVAAAATTHPQSKRRWDKTQLHNYFHRPAKEHEVNKFEWKTWRIIQGSTPCEMGRDVDLQNMAPTQRGMGNPTRSHRGRIRDVHQQTWSRWKNQINWVHYASERVVAASISVIKQPIILVSVYMPHSGYQDHQVAKTYKTISTAIEKRQEYEDHRRRLQRGAWPRRGYRIIVCRSLCSQKSIWKRRMNDTVVNLKTISLHWTRCTKSYRNDRWLTIHRKVWRNSWITSWPTENMIAGAKTQRPTIQLTWEATTDALWQSSKFQSKKETSSQRGASDWSWQSHMRRWTWVEVEWPRAGSERRRTREDTKEGSGSKGINHNRSSSRCDGAAAASSATAGGKSITKSYAVATEATEAP